MTKTLNELFRVFRKGDERDELLAMTSQSRGTAKYGHRWRKSCNSFSRSYRLDLFTHSPHLPLPPLPPHPPLPPPPSLSSCDLQVYNYNFVIDLTKFAHSESPFLIFLRVLHLINSSNGSRSKSNYNDDQIE